MAQDTGHTGNAPSGHTGEQEPSGPGHRKRITTHQAGTPVNRSRVIGTRHKQKQRTKRAHP